jgi:serine/arginine repetitive matrix protein 2
VIDVPIEIRSIVNGLRDEDAESFYDNRASFASEYSGEGVKVSFKEHGRKSSKSSNTSFVSRKAMKPSSSASASQRPETKVRIAT